jgi:trigger factor
MEIKKDTQSNGQIKFQVNLSSQECQDAYKTALKDVQNNFNQKGFRQGKAPENIIKKNASDRLFASYEQIVAQKALKQVLQQEKELRPALRPEIKILSSALGNSFKCEVLITPYPNISLGKYTDLKIKKEKINVSNQEIEKALNFLKQSRAKFKTVSRTAKKGDQLDIDYDAYHKDKKIPQGSTQHYPLRLGESKLHKDFEKQLIGMKEKDQKSFSINFANTWPQEEFKGKKIDFKVKINSVSAVELPKLDDKFAQSLGNFKTLKQLKDSLKKGLAQEKRQANQKKTQEEVLKKIIQDSQIAISPFLIEKEKERIANNFKQQLKDKKIDPESYLKKINITQKELDNNFQKQAQEQLESAFVINEIAKKEKLFPVQEEVQKHINERLKKSENFQKSPQDIDFDALRSYTFQYLTNQKVINWLLDKNICV